MSLHQQNFEIFKKLHYSENPLILPNVWDALGAALLENMGYPAIATSSSAIALSHGYHDGEHIPFDEHLKILSEIVKAVSVPVTADIESDYAQNDFELSENINKLLDIGIVGINFEDSEKKNNQLISIEEQTRKIELIKNTAAKKGLSLFVNARIDTYVHGDQFTIEEKLEETLKRAEAYKNAGADALFPIIINNEDHIKTLIQKAGLPINVMVFAGCPDASQLKELGVQRISMGSSYFKIALQEMRNFAKEVLNYNTLELIKSNSITSNYVESLIK